jgi:hypothetical protein
MSVDKEVVGEVRMQSLFDKTTIEFKATNNRNDQF